VIAIAIVLLVFSAALLKDHDEYFAPQWYEVVGIILAFTGRWLLLAGVVEFLWRVMP
jgi:protein-S-isoprenylcysteine O-methyltransferase Ste14